MPKKPRLDRVDLEILHLLQTNGSLTAKHIAKQVGLSQTPCWKRINQLEERGLIRARVALLDAAKLNIGVTAFVVIRPEEYTEKWNAKFTHEMKSIPEVVEVYRMLGTVDYMLRIIVPDIAAFDRIYKNIISKVNFSSVTSMLSTEQIKYTTALPLAHTKVENESD